MNYADEAITALIESGKLPVELPCDEQLFDFCEHIEFNHPELQGLPFDEFVEAVAEVMKRYIFMYE